jgi:hypothetical protein
LIIRANCFSILTIKGIDLCIPSFCRLAGIFNVLAADRISWHIYPMSVLRQRAWSSLGIGLLLALSACGTLPAASGKHKSDPATAASTGIVQSLQKEIRDRDKRIAELESRLDALKVIDQDIEKQKKFNRPPASVTPADSLFP